MPDSPDELIAWLERRVASDPRRGAEGWDLARRFFRLLGDPQDGAPAVHVVGTAGKGSVVGILTDRLAAAGVGVVTHQSPHVYDIRERFLLDGRLPDWPEVLDCAATVIGAADAIEDETGRGPSFFAVTAALAWELGRRHDADVAVVEAGIGGRFDATNVMARPDVLTIITAIGLDHVELLGATVEAIATEKAAVLTGRSDAILAPQPDPSAKAVIEAAAVAAGCRLHHVDVGEDTADWRLAAVATVQAALPLLEKRLSLTIPAGDMADTAFPPGRFEVVTIDGRRVVFDGAHNPMKLAGLADVLAKGPGPACVVAAVGGGKDLAACAAVLASMAAPGVIVATEFGAASSLQGGPGPRSWSASRLAAAVAAHGAQVETAVAPAEVATAVRRLTSTDDTVVVTGSLLHLAAVRAALEG